ncbi:hypothetical protein ElyMa_005861700 [Elysia marginata]|uniref:Uncharacterized protein n=1 Tax=Elysia marginata TaxID=1093978 RepID=A0AAV4G0V8_9GAST|nr:hypothetical protein ElyMa_005861700 [Elysia marginata]
MNFKGTEPKRRNRVTNLKVPEPTQRDRGLPENQFVIVLTTGLDLTLTRAIPAIIGTRRFCRVVTCSKGTESSKAGNDTTNSTLVFNSILSMSLVKRVSDTTNKLDVLVALVTMQEPSLMQETNSMTVVGSLEAARATVRVELEKREDCQSEFTCYVLGVDSQGREAVSTASLVQQPRRMDDGKVMSSLPLHLQSVASIQQLVTQSVAGLEDNMRQLQTDLYGRIESFESEVEDKMEQFQRHFSDQIKSYENNVNSWTETLDNNLKDQIEQLLKYCGDKSDTFEQRIDNKLDLFENRIEDEIDNYNSLNKLIQLDIKMSTYLDQFRSQAKTYIVDFLENLKQEMHREQEQALRNISGRVEEFLSKTSGLLTSMKGEFDIFKSYDQINIC